MINHLCTSVLKKLQAADMKSKLESQANFPDMFDGTITFERPKVNVQDAKFYILHTSFLF